MGFILVNFWAVILSSVLVMVLGALWYSPLLFGNKWAKYMEMSGANLKEMQQGAGKAYAVHFVTNLVSGYVLALLLKHFELTGATTGVVLAVWLWVGFVVTNALSNSMWHKRPCGLVMIEVVYQLVSMLIMGAVIGSWQ